MFSVLLTLLLPWSQASVATSEASSEILVSNPAQLRKAVGEAKPGTIIRIAPGTYPGGVSASGLQGTAEAPIVIRAADPAHPPVFQGGGSAFQLSDVAHLEIHDLVIEKATGNGLNIDDAGTIETPTHHVLLRGLVVRDIGPRGNHDGIKLSGVDDFLVETCTIESWGSGGSGIDMVGCHRGVIRGGVFRHGDNDGADGVQAKGGSSEIVVERCRFLHAGQRAVNIGGSTGLAYFRPKVQGHEAKRITVRDCLFVGSMSPAAFVGVDEADFEHNTIIRPTRWGFRILQETREPGFVPCRNGRIVANLIVYRSDEMVVPINIGDGTAPETFQLDGNAWYCLDRPERARLNLPVRESNGRSGIDPQFRDLAAGDYRLRPGSPLSGVGCRVEDVLAAATVTPGR